MDLRAFTYGIIVGIAITVGSLWYASWLAGVKWQPVKIVALAQDERHAD